MASWAFGALERERYGLILSDPPWKFKTYADDISPKSAASKYTLMTRSELRNLPVYQLAAKDCALVMWATQAQVPEALDLLACWGFVYKTMGAWGKLSKASKIEDEDRKKAFGTGYILRSAAEFFIIGARGNPKVATRSERNWIEAPVREHSRKPDEMHEMLERMYPNARKCELFGRGRRDGWDVWGNERTRFS